MEEGEERKNKISTLFLVLLFCTIIQIGGGELADSTNGSHAFGTRGEVIFHSRTRSRFGAGEDGEYIHSIGRGHDGGNNHDV